MRYTTRWVLAASVLGLAVSLTPSFGGDGEMTDNPFYKHWAAFKKGTTVVHTEKTTFGDDATSDLPGGVEEKIVMYKLLSVSPEKVVVEAIVIEKEFLNSTESAPTKIIYPAKVNKAHLNAVLLAAGAKRGDETLKVKVGKEEMAIKCETIAGSRKKKDEQVAQKLWMSTTVPGGIVKRTRTTMHDGNLVAETTILVRAFKIAE
jgi:hypothetical protein